MKEINLEEVRKTDKELKDIQDLLKTKKDPLTAVLELLETNKKLNEQVDKFEKEKMENEFRSLVVKMFFGDFHVFPKNTHVAISKRDLEQELINIEESVKMTNKTRKTNYSLESYSCREKYNYIKELLNGKKEDQ